MNYHIKYIVKVILNCIFLLKKLVIEENNQKLDNKGRKDPYSY